VKHSDAGHVEKYRKLRYSRAVRVPVTQEQRSAKEAPTKVNKFISALLKFV
jgi:hypothetical protein